MVSMSKHLTEYQRKYRLTNVSRKYFGLNKVTDDLDEVNIKEGTILYYKGNIIKKIISWSYVKTYEYTEYDTEIITKNRKMLLPKTARGKEKKITPSNILNIKPLGIKFFFMMKNKNWESIISVNNYVNNIKLPLEDFKDIDSIKELEFWIDKYIESCPSNYFEKIKRIKNEKQRKIKFKEGDIFRVEIDREYYGYGLIIANIRKLEKKNFFIKDHPMLNLMTMPILIRLYKFETTDRDIPVSEIIKNPLLESKIVSDNDILWGTHEIIGNKNLDEEDIDFSIQAGISISKTGEKEYKLAWGKAFLKIADESVIKKIIEIEKNESLNHLIGAGKRFSKDGVSISISVRDIRESLYDKYGYTKLTNLTDIRLEVNENEKSKIFKLLGINSSFTFDDFNKKYSGITRNDYIQYLENIK